MFIFSETVLVGKDIISLVIEKYYLCAEYALKDKQSSFSSTTSASQFFYAEIVKKHHNLKYQKKISQVQLAKRKGSIRTLMGLP